MGTLFLTKEARIRNGAKTISSINGAWKTGQLHGKNEIRTLPNTMLLLLLLLSCISHVQLCATP